MTLLELRNLVAYYGDFQALFGVNLEVREGEALALIGSNGAGKTTTIRSITGLLRAPAESIKLSGKPIGGMAPEQIVKLGVGLVPEGRKLFPSLSVEENLMMGRYPRTAGPWSLRRVYDIFPVLQERRNSPSNSLSGGQQQMVAIGRALTTNPKLLICDELSLGLAPRVIVELYEVLREIRRQGTTMIIVEQDINRAMKFSDRVYCLQEGRVTLEGRPSELTRDEIKRAYFGI
jgi:branched-chain amino acid transport system ATP-binding protein